MKLARLFWMTLVSLLFALPAMAVDLTGKQVESFVSCMKDLKPYFDTYSDEVGDESETTTATELMSDWTASLKEQREVLDILKKHGLDLNAWGTLSQQVTQAYMALKLGSEGKNVIQEMRDSLNELETSKDIPEDQKVEIRKQMQKSIEEFEKSLQTPKDAQDAVRPYLKQLDSIFEWEDE